MLLKIENFYKSLQDPEKKKYKLRFLWKNRKIASIKKNNKKIKIIFNLPILIDFSDTIIEKKLFNNSKLNYSLIGKKNFFFRKIKSLIFGTYFNSKKAIDLFKKSMVKNSTILILGGGNIGTGLDKIYKSKDIKIISTDIYPSNNIQFISDCHNIPLKNESVDGVIIQAVLEHVLKPEQVINEVYRVLKKKRNSFCRNSIYATFS